MTISPDQQEIEHAAALLRAGKLCAFPTETVYGLGADGKRGVTKALEIIRKELDMTMALCGRRDINTVGKDMLHR